MADAYCVLTSGQALGDILPRVISSSHLGGKYYHLSPFYWWGTRGSRQVTQGPIAKPECLANCPLSFSRFRRQAEPSFTWSRIQRHPRGVCRPSLLEPDCCQGTVRLHIPHSASDKSSPGTAHHGAQWTTWPKSNRGSFREAKAQGSQNSCSDSSVEVETAARWDISQGCTPPKYKPKAGTDAQASRGILIRSQEDCY